MELNIDLSSLWANVRQMTKHRVEITLEKLPELDLITSTSGVEIEIEEIDFTQQLATYRGKQVILFIPDHSYGSTFYDTQQDPSKGKRFHLTFCETLEKMQLNQRYKSRYFATTNLSGKFTISNQNGESAEVKLLVCQKCLEKLNYKSFKQNRQQVLNDFDLNEFFAHYQTDFHPKLNTTGMDPRKAGSYAENWKVISQQIRQKRGWRCESCKLNLRQYPYLLDVHHRDGNKRNNSERNLQVLCRKCHTEQDMHEHMALSFEEKRIFERLAREQRLI